MPCWTHFGGKCSFAKCHFVQRSRGELERGKELETLGNSGGNRPNANCVWRNETASSEVIPALWNYQVKWIISNHFKRVHVILHLVIRISANGITAPRPVGMTFSSSFTSDLKGKCSFLCSFLSPKFFWNDLFLCPFLCLLILSYPRFPNCCQRPTIGHPARKSCTISSWGRQTEQLHPPRLSPILWDDQRVIKHAFFNTGWTFCFALRFILPTWEPKKHQLIYY